MRIFSVGRLVKSLLLVAIILLLDGTGRLDSHDAEVVSESVFSESGSAFDSSMLHLYEKNVIYRGAGIRGYTCRTAEVYTEEELPEIIDLSERSARLLFTLKCVDSGFDDIQVTTENLFRYSRDNPYQYAKYEIDIPEKTLEDLEGQGRNYYWNKNQFKVGKVRWDLSDEAVRRGLQDSAMQRNWYLGYSTRGFVELQNLYITGNTVVRFVVKLFLSFAVIASLFITIPIAITIIMLIGAKKDRRYKTGYKNNKTPDEIAKEGLTLTRRMMRFGGLNLFMSAMLLVLLIVLNGSLDPHALFGAVVAYTQLLALTGIFVVAFALILPLKFFFSL